MLKADFHIHSSLDPIDRLSITPKQIIDKAYKMDYRILAFTHHKRVVFPENLVEYVGLMRMDEQLFETGR